MAGVHVVALCWQGKEHSTVTVPLSQINVFHLVHYSGTVMKTPLCEQKTENKMMITTPANN